MLRPTGRPTLRLRSPVFRALGADAVCVQMDMNAFVLQDLATPRIAHSLDRQTGQMVCNAYKKWGTQ